MKAKSIIHLHNGRSVKVRQDIDALVVQYAQMARSNPGSAFEFHRVTDHGTVKRIFVPVGLITHLEEI